MEQKLQFLQLGTSTQPQSHLFSTFLHFFQNFIRFMCMSILLASKCTEYMQCPWEPQGHWISGMVVRDGFWAARGVLGIRPGVPCKVSSVCDFWAISPIPPAPWIWVSVILRNNQWSFPTHNSKNAIAIKANVGISFLKTFLYILVDKRLQKTTF